MRAHGYRLPPTLLRSYGGQVGDPEDRLRRGGAEGRTHAEAQRRRDAEYAGPARAKATRILMAEAVKVLALPPSPRLRRSGRAGERKRLAHGGAEARRGRESFLALRAGRLRAPSHHTRHCEERVSATKQSRGVRHRVCRFWVASRSGFEKVHRTFSLASREPPLTLAMTKKERAVWAPRYCGFRPSILPMTLSRVRLEATAIRIFSERRPLTAE